MSHFNLNNGLPRRRYIGPTHGLAHRPGTASLENLGGRIIIENEMYCHKQRLREIRPSIDSGRPWAHQYQDVIRRGGSPTGRGGSKAPSGAADGGASAAPRSVNAHPPGSRPGTAGSGVTASRSLQRSRGVGGGANHHPQSPSGGSSATPTAGGTSSTRNGTFDPSALADHQQTTYKDLVQLLSSLPQPEAKGLLEQAYREGEERKLLMAYTGVFPGAAADGAESSASEPGSPAPAPAAAAEGPTATATSTTTASAAAGAASSASSSDFGTDAEVLNGTAAAAPPVARSRSSSSADDRD